MTSDKELPDLFDLAPEQDDPTSDPVEVLGPYGARARLVRLNPQSIGNSVGRSAQRIRLNLFPAAQNSFTGSKDVAVPFEPVALLDPPASDGGIMTVTGRLEDDPDARLSIVLVGEVMNLHLFSPENGEYEAEPFSGSTYVIRQIDDVKVPECGTKETIHQEDVDDVTNKSTDSVAKLLIVYTSLVKRRLGGDAGVQARAALAVKVGNDVLVNSLLPIRLCLAATVELPDYIEISGKQGYNKMLNQLERGTATGLQQLHQLRDQYQADLVSLLVDNPSLGGLANVMGHPRKSFEKFAYSVVNYRVSASNWTLIHEIGHNFGCCHETGCISAKSYSRGHTFQANARNWKTVMVRMRVTGKRIPYFSNPLQTFLGAPTGTEQRNNAQVMSEAMSTVERFRPRPGAADQRVNESAV